MQNHDVHLYLNILLPMTAILGQNLVALYYPARRASRLIRVRGVQARHLDVVISRYLRTLIARLGPLQLEFVTRNVSFKVCSYIHFADDNYASSTMNSARSIKIR